MNKILRQLPSISFIIILVVTSFFLIFLHETVHQEIYRSYDIESKIIFNNPKGLFFTGGFATQTEPYLIGKCPDSCELAHNINEAVSYIFIPAFGVIGIGIWILICFLEIIVTFLIKFEKEFKK